MTGAFEMLRSLSMIAVIALAVGLAGYLALCGPAVALAGPDRQGAAIASGPASDDWNLPKHI